MFEEKDIQFLDNTAKSFLSIVKKIVTGWAYSKAEVDSAVSTGMAGLYSIRGSFDISGGSFPTTGGRGVGGLPKAGDGWNISVGGTAGGIVFNAGDNIVALIDTPGQTAANWQKGEGNLGFTPENSSNKENITLDNSTSKYPTNRLVKEAIDAKQDVLSLGSGVASALAENIGSPGGLVISKTLTAMTPSGGDGSVSVAHGLDASKILGVIIRVDYGDTTMFLGDNYTTQNGSNIGWHINATNFNLQTSTSNSGNILSKIFKVTIFYTP